MQIAIRYPMVELLTAGFYLFIWGRFGLPLAPLFWIFVSLLLAATFIDFDHLIIPDEITLGGTAVGILFSTLVPSLMGASSWVQGFLLSLFGAAVGYFLLWGVVELGKMAFGRRRIRPEAALSFEIEGSGNETVLRIGEEIIPLEELFYRKGDLVESSCAWLEIDGERLGSGTLSINHACMKFGDREWALPLLEDVAPIRAEVTELVLPREAMGFGDVKFLACIGAFLGWRGVFFSLFAGSVAGALIGIFMLLVTRGRMGGRIPFGPYLALGALLWVFAGPDLLELYSSWLWGGGGFFLSPRHPPM